jgi:uncharacterized protein YjbI with pentapeptide repeats
LGTSRIIGWIAFACVVLASLASAHAKPTRAEVIAYLDSCKAQQVRADLIAQFGTDYTNMDLRGVDFRGHYYARNESNLAGADFTGSDLRDANLSAAFLDDANFTDAKLDRVAFVTSRLHRATMTRATLDGAFLHGSQFDGAMLDGVDFSKAKVDGVRFVGASMRQAHLSSIDADSLYNDFSKADLTRAELPAARIDAASFRGATLTHANLTLASLRNADFTGADLTGATFIDADVQFAIFQGVRGVSSAELESLVVRADRASFDRRQAMQRAVDASWRIASLAAPPLMLGLTVALLACRRRVLWCWWLVVAVIANLFALVPIGVLLGIFLAGSSTTAQLATGSSQTMTAWMVWAGAWPIFVLGLLAFAVLCVLCIVPASLDAFRRRAIWVWCYMVLTTLHVLLMLRVVFLAFPDA